MMKSLFVFGLFSVLPFSGVAIAEEHHEQAAPTEQTAKTTTATSGNEKHHCNCGRKNHHAHDEHAQSQSQKAPADTIQTTLAIKGMHCSGCAQVVREALLESGLKPEQILDVKVGSAKVWYPKAEFVAEKTPCQLIEKLSTATEYKYSVKGGPKCSAAPAATNHT